MRMFRISRTTITTIRPVPPGRATEMTESHLVGMVLRTMKKMLIWLSSTIVRAVLVQMKRRWMITKKMLKWLI
jgi:hypothetical protein